MGIKSKAVGMITNIFSAGAAELTTAAFSGLDSIITSKEEEGAQALSMAEVKAELQKARYQFNSVKMDYEYKIKDQEYKDRDSARKMYMADSSLQKIFAITFLIGYIGISAAMLTMIFGFFGVTGVQLDAFEASIVSMIFTAMSTKINTIVDFLFGGSKTSDDSEKRIAESFQEKAGQAM